jgi:hypothetical protein
MMVVMEQEKNLKEEIVAAVEGSLESLRGEFWAFNAEITGGIQSLEAKLEAKMDTGFHAVDAGFHAVDAGFRAVDARFQGVDSQMRGQGVLLEKMQGDIDILVEGQEVLNGQVDRLDGRMGCVEEKLDRMDVKLDVLADDVRKKADREEVHALERRVIHLEAS